MSGKVQVLGLGLSERKGGNSDQLLGWTLGSCEEAGARVKRIDLREYHINPCRVCGGCLKKSSCVFEDDDFHKVLGSIMTADRLVVATPLYFMGLPSRGKAFVDRCQSLWNLKYRLNKPQPTHPDRRGLVLMVGGARMKDMFTGIRLTMRAFFDVTGFSYWMDLTYSGVDKPGDLHEEAQSDAIEAGKDLVQPLNKEAQK